MHTAKINLYSMEEAFFRVLKSDHIDEELAIKTLRELRKEETATHDHFQIMLEIMEKHQDEFIPISEELQDILEIDSGEQLYTLSPYYR